MDPAAPIIALYSLVPLAFVGFLLVYHVILTMEDRTTNEKLKAMYKTQNPYSRGCWRNMLHRWCGPFRARYIKMHLSEMESLTEPPANMGEDPDEYEMAMQFSDSKVNLVVV